MKITATVILSIICMCYARDYYAVNVREAHFDYIEQISKNQKDVPECLDWREKGIIVAVQDQGQCGQSEVINAVDALSAVSVLQTGKPLVALSQQQIFDCSTDPHWCPCGASGNASDIYNFLLQQYNGSIDTAVSYPLTGKCDSVCHFKSSGTGATLSAYVYNVDIDETVLFNLIQYGPVTAEVDASLSSFQTYAAGIYDDPDCTGDQVSHSLLVVGYGTENGEDFWIARNSWGSTWGEKGYIRIARNKGNMCGIATKLALPWTVQC